MGINPDFEIMAKKVQEFASTQQQTDGIAELVLQLENVCMQACKELESEYEVLKKIKVWNVHERMSSSNQIELWQVSSI